MKNKEDILVELCNEDIEGLEEMYKSYEDELPHLTSFLRTCIRSKKNGMTDFVKVMSPGNCWREDGTFIAFMPNNGRDIVLHSLDPSGKNLMEGLSKTRIIQFVPDSARSFTVLFAVHELFCTKLVDVLTSVLHCNITGIKKYEMWYLPKEKALQINIMPLHDIYVKELEPKDICVVNSYWEYRYADSEKKHLNWLKLNYGYGVYLKSNDKLVSWLNSSCLGQLAGLQTLDGYKQKGYASLAVKTMAKRLAENGFHCCSTVSEENLPSQNFFKKLGFERIFSCQYIYVENDKQ